MTDKIELIGLTKNELAACLREMGEPAFRVKQIWQWVYFYGKTDFNEMTNLSKALRQKLAERFVLSRPKTVTEQLSSDKTRKWLLEFADGEKSKPFIFRKPIAARSAFPPRSAAPWAAASVIPAARS